MELHVVLEQLLVLSVKHHVADRALRHVIHMLLNVNDQLSQLIVRIADVTERTFGDKILLKMMLVN